MTVTVNGEVRTTDASTVQQLLDQLQLDARAVVVELNRVIVRRPSVSTTAVADGDVVEIVHFVGGG